MHTDLNDNTSVSSGPREIDLGSWRRQQLDGKDIDIFRWTAMSASEPTEQFDNHILELLNDWCEANPGRKVTSISTNLAWGPFGLDDSNVPRYTVQLHSQELPSGERYQPGERGFSITRTHGDSGMSFGQEDARVEADLSHYLKSNRDRDIRAMACQFDFGKFGAADDQIARYVVFLHWQKRPEGAEYRANNDPRHFHALRWNGEALYTDGASGLTSKGIVGSSLEEDLSMQQVFKTWGTGHAGQELLHHTIFYQWAPIGGGDGGFLPRCVCLLYSEDSTPSLNEGVLVTRWFGNTCFNPLPPETSEETEAANVINSWIKEHPEKIVNDITMQWDYGPYYAAGWRGPRYFFTLHWKDNPDPQAIAEPDTRRFLLSRMTAEHIGGAPSIMATDESACLYPKKAKVDDNMETGAISEYLKMLRSSYPDKVFDVAKSQYTFGGFYHGASMQSSSYLFGFLIRDRDDLTHAPK